MKTKLINIFTHRKFKNLMVIIRDIINLKLKKQINILFQINLLKYNQQLTSQK